MAAIIDRAWGIAPFSLLATALGAGGPTLRVPVLSRPCIGRAICSISETFSGHLGPVFPCVIVSAAAFKPLDDALKRGFCAVVPHDQSFYLDAARCRGPGTRQAGHRGQRRVGPLNLTLTTRSLETSRPAAPKSHPVPLLISASAKSPFSARPAEMTSACPQEAINNWPTARPQWRGGFQRRLLSGSCTFLGSRRCVAKPVRGTTSTVPTLAPRHIP